MSLSFSEVCEVIQTERDYQNRQGNNWQHKNKPSVEAELLLMEEYLQKARTAWVTIPGNEQTLDILRKVVGVGVRCFENHGCPKRNI
jgi:hypothetical protein